MRILVSGFGPFHEHAVNPSERLARALAGHRARGVALLGHAPLPVVYGASAGRLMAVARACGARGVVALGLAARSAHVRLERFATNTCCSGEPDTSGRARLGHPVVPGAPMRLETRVDPRPIARALAAAGIASELSEDAGGFVCNDLYYRLLAARVPAIFVHVPPGDVARLVRPLAMGIAAAWTTGVAPA